MRGLICEMEVRDQVAIWKVESGNLWTLHSSFRLGGANVNKKSPLYPLYPLCRVLVQGCSSPPQCSYSAEFH